MVVCLTSLAWWLATLGHTASDVIRTLRGHTMGTTYVVHVVVPAGMNIKPLQQELETCLESINSRLSTWREDSEISQFNRCTQTAWFDVSRETAEVVAAGLAWAKETEGAFDVTVGPLVALWQFGPAARPEPPSPQEVAEVRQRVGWHGVEVRHEPPALRKLRPDVELDLSGIAKGYAVDEVARRLDRLGLTAYLVEIGGELRAKGTKPDGTTWRIGIETPLVDQRRIGRTLELSDVALATSGDYRLFREGGQGRWSHLIDPRSGLPVPQSLVSVTVLGENCQDCDALATALMVLGPERGWEWCLARDVAALWIVHDHGQFKERFTPAFARRMTGLAEQGRGITWPRGLLLAGGGVLLLAGLWWWRRWCDRQVNPEARTPA